MALKESDPTPARMRRRGVAAAVAAVTALAFVGCGSDEEKSGQAQTPANPLATAPSATAPPAGATTPDTPETTPPESQPGGAGDEEGIAVQASILLEDGKLTPAVVKVPAFLPIELVVISTEGIDRKLAIATKDGTRKTFKVKALEQATFTLPGLSKGEHAIYLDGKQAAKLDAGN